MDQVKLKSEATLNFSLLSILKITAFDHNLIRLSNVGCGHFSINYFSFNLSSKQDMKNVISLPKKSLI